MPAGIFGSVGNAAVRISSRDTGVSGTALIEYRIDGGEWQASRNPELFCSGRGSVH